ncbi:GAF domain-containing protein [Spongisporangium articulatum]|uniref:GAF domain-containing protein n=1 Tax=Spongisporangium articulatum TaxID=3362603 RepID=A0ABW8AKF2_9ACTN
MVEDDGRVAEVHERFLAAPALPLSSTDIRPIVAESWRRSLALGVDPNAGAAPLDMAEDELRAYRDSHPLAPMMPLIRRLLTEDADEAGHIVAVGDELGRLLWVEGHHRLRSRAEDMWFVEGALWSERGAGTNAPGTALAVDAPVQIRAAEHFGLNVQAWSCVAAPVHDPLTGRMLGVIDLTGASDVAHPRALALVRACAAAVEAGLALQVGASRAHVEQAGARTTTARLALMGAATGVFRLGAQEFRLSRRHAELVWLLAGAPQGLTAQELDALLHDDGEHLVTVRVEINRLRRVLGDQVLQSRPYRLAVGVSTDLDDVRALLNSDRLLDAVSAYAGRPLAGSEAPGVRARTEEFVAELRHAVLDSRSAPVLERWTANAEGHDDAQAWAALAEALPLGSARRAMAQAHVVRLAL